MGYAHWLPPLVNGNHVGSIRRGKCKKRWAQGKADEHTMACWGRLKGDTKGGVKASDSGEQEIFCVWGRLWDALSRKEGVSSWKKRLSLVLRGNASKAFTFQISNDLAPFTAEAVDVGSLILQNVACCALLYSWKMLHVPNWGIYLCSQHSEMTQQILTQISGHLLKPSVWNFSIRNSHLKRGDRIKL